MLWMVLAWPSLEVLLPQRNLHLLRLMALPWPWPVSWFLQEVLLLFPQRHVRLLLWMVRWSGNGFVARSRAAAAVAGSSHNPWNRRSRTLVPSSDFSSAAAGRVKKQMAESPKNTRLKETMLLLEAGGDGLIAQIFCVDVSDWINTPANARSMNAYHTCAVLISSKPRQIISI